MTNVSLTDAASGITGGSPSGTGGVINVSSNVSTSGTITNIGAGSAGVTISGVISNASALTQNSPTSSLTLTNTNTYAGPTHITAGMLMLTTGSINSSAAVNVANTGALTLGNSTALSDTGTLTMVSGSTLNLNAANGTSEIIGNLILDGTTEPAGTYTYMQLTGFDSGITFTSSFGETLTIAAVPEPSTLLGGLLGFGLVGYILRRRMSAALCRQPVG